MSKHQVEISTLKDSAQAIVEIVRKDPNATIENAKNGAIELTKETYSAILDHLEIPAAVADKLETSRGEIAAAVVIVGGELSNAAAAKEKGLESVTTTLPGSAKSSFKAVWSREKQYPDPKNGGTTSTFGAITPQYDSYSTSGSRGVVKAARALITAQAKELFAKK